MSSATDAKSLGFLASIRGKIALANLVSVLVLLAVAVVASVQFRELGRVLNAVSDGAEVLMRLSHAYDERDQLLTSYRKGYSDAAEPNPDARVRFAAVAENLQSHAHKAREKLAGGKGAALLAKAESGIGGALHRAEGLDRLPADDREAAAIETEEALTDAIDQLAEAKLAASTAMAERLADVKLALQKPARLFGSPRRWAG